ncbi:hypothetical protein AAHA92_15511 [Salvia divinorum]|uniref:Uncharacterized protein n=1 Tax=Salvia divinorum TaxID=28513 RepID=A0ABD1HI90_SALDI
MLPYVIVKVLSEKQEIVFTSDSEDEKVEKKPKRRKTKKSGFVMALCPEKKYTGFKIICSFEQFQPSIAPLVKVQLAKVRLDNSSKLGKSIEDRNQQLNTNAQAKHNRS